MKDDPRGRLDYQRLRVAIGERNCSKLELLDWTFNRIGYDPQEIPNDDWPSYGAVAFLVWANVHYEDFLALWAKTIPTQAQLKLLDRPKDDGRVLGIMDMLDKEFYAASAEGHSGEPALPTGSVGTGPHQPDGA